MQSQNRSRLWLGALFVATLALGTDEFVIAGVLPEVAADLRVSTGAAGQLVTAFALSFAVGTPLLAVWLDRCPRRPVLALGLAAFVLVNLGCALAPDLTSLLVLRALAGLSAGVVSTSAFAIAADAAPPGRQGRYLAVVTAGLTVALFTGVPVGAWLAELVDWRATFVLIGAVALLAAVVAVSTLPALPGAPVTTLAARLAPLRRAALARLVAAITLCGTGGLMFYTYLGPVSALSVGSDQALPLLLLLVGLVGVVAAVGSGRLTDSLGPRRARLLIIGGHAALLLAIAAVAAGGGPGWVFVVLVGLWSLAAWALSPPMQASALAAAPETPMTAISLIISGLYLGTAGAGALGGLVVDRLGAEAVPLVGAAALLGALVLAWEAPSGRGPLPRTRAGGRRARLRGSGPVEAIWEGQGELRWSMEQLADDALDAAGIELDPRGYLVALPRRGDGTLLLEPADAPVDLTMLGEPLGSGEPDDPGAPDPRPGALGAAAEPASTEDVTPRLETALTDEERALVVGTGRIVGEHLVVPVLALARDPWEQLSRFTRDHVGGERVPTCYPEAVVREVLRAASRELDRSSPAALAGVDPGTILRRAADRFVDGALARTGQAHAQGCRDALDEVSVRTYEGRSGLGTLVLARREHPAVVEEVTFDQPVPMSIPRSLRKALEMAGGDLALISDGREVHGLGSVRDEDDLPREDVVEARVVGTGSWELWHADTPFLRVDNGRPGLPREPIDPTTFADVVDRVFAGSTEADPAALWSMAQACARQDHGTILVVHPQAATEGQRLLPQAHTIRPTRLGGRALSTLSGIDGAVLVAPDGRCHAVGVILDGVATGTGDPSRGARYNSAIRYLAGAGRGAMVIIVSEDGWIDVLPTPKRRVRRATVAQAVQRLVAAADEGTSQERFARLDNALERLEFYLDAAQCEAVNDARERVEQRRWQEHRTRDRVVPVRPHPAMDESYFLEPVG